MFFFRFPDIRHIKHPKGNHYNSLVHIASTAFHRQRKYVKPFCSPLWMRQRLSEDLIQFEIGLDMWDMAKKMVDYLGEIIEHLSFCMI